VVTADMVRAIGSSVSARQLLKGFFNHSIVASFNRSLPLLITAVA
jgi:hypothetical protein